MRFLHFSDTHISTHAPPEGSDLVNRIGDVVIKSFQPTLPLRGATCALHRARFAQGISTHAPPEGSDGIIKLELRAKHISTHAPPEGSDFLLGSEV